MSIREARNPGFGKVTLQTRIRVPVITVVFPGASAGSVDLKTAGGRSRPEAGRRRVSGDGDVARTVGRNFRTAREEQRLSQEQVAALSSGHSGGVSRTLISAIERGRNLPGIEALVSVPRVLNIEPREILERVDLSGALRGTSSSAVWFYRCVDLHTAQR
jgi:DNA-binding XRE family transcriptional regulator